MSPTPDLSRPNCSRWYSSVVQLVVPSPSTASGASSSFSDPSPGGGSNAMASATWMDVSVVSAVVSAVWASSSSPVPSLSPSSEPERPSSTPATPSATATRMTSSVGTSQRRSVSAKRTGGPAPPLGTTGGRGVPGTGVSGTRTPGGGGGGAMPVVPPEASAVGAGAGVTSAWGPVARSSAPALSSAARTSAAVG